MKAVTIHICSQSDGDAAGRTEYSCRGQLAEKNGSYYALYEEPPQFGITGVKTTLKWRGGRVVLLRSGKLEQRQEFYRGYTDRSLYRTPYLTLALVTVTESVWAEGSGGHWRLELRYTLLHGDQPYGRMRVRIEIEEEDASGH